MLNEMRCIVDLLFNGYGFFYNECGIFFEQMSWYVASEGDIVV